METNDKMRCPFVYEGGKRCEGHITRVKAFGPSLDDGIYVKKVRVWCSLKDNHEGTASTWESKERMEFYPDKLPADIHHPVLALFDRGEREIIF